MHLFVNNLLPQVNQLVGYVRMMDEDLLKRRVELITNIALLILTTAALVSYLHSKYLEWTKGFSGKSLLGEDLVKEFRQKRLKISDVAGNDKVFDEIFTRGSSRVKRHSWLIGPPGSGKTATIMALAKRIAEGRVPDRYKAYKVFSVRTNDLIAGANYIGVFPDRIKRLFSEIEAAGKAFVFLDEFHTVAGMGSYRGHTSADFPNIIKPYLTESDKQYILIGATTPAEAEKYLLSDRAFTERFHQITQPEPTVEQTIEILKKIHKPIVEDRHGFQVEDAAIDEIVKVTKNLSGAFPRKAVVLLDIIASRKEHQNDKTPLTVQNVNSENVPASASNLPYAKELVSSCLTDSLRMPDVYGSDTVLNRVFINGMSFGQKHSLLIGRSGVGKTSIFRALAKKIAKKEAPEHFWGYKVFLVDTNHAYQISFAEKVRLLFEEINKVGKAFVVFDDFQEAAKYNLSNMLRPYLDCPDKEYIILLATTPFPQNPNMLLEIQSKQFLKDPTFCGKFNLIEQLDLTEEETIEMLKNAYKPFIVESYQIEVQDDAIQQIVSAAKRRDGAFPKKAVDLLYQVVASKRRRGDSTPITAFSVQQVLQLSQGSIVSTDGLNDID